MQPANNFNGFSEIANNNQIIIFYNSDDVLNSVENQTIAGDNTIVKTETDVILYPENQTYAVAEVTPEATGGVKTGANPLDLETIEGNKVKGTTKGANVLTKATSLLTSAVSLLGFGMTISANIEANVCRLVEVMYDEPAGSLEPDMLDKYKIAGLQVVGENNIHYIPDSILKKIAKGMQDLGWFTVQEQTDIPTELGLHAITGTPPLTAGLIENFIRETYASHPTDPIFPASRITTVLNLLSSFFNTTAGTNFLNYYSGCQEIFLALNTRYIYSNDMAIRVEGYRYNDIKDNININAVGSGYAHTGDRIGVGNFISSVDRTLWFYPQGNQWRDDGYQTKVSLSGGYIGVYNPSIGTINVSYSSNINISKNYLIDGLYAQENATVPTPDTDIDNLEELYPELYANKLTLGGINFDTGNLLPVHYIPARVNPSANILTEPVTEEQQQTQTGLENANELEQMAQNNPVAVNTLPTPASTGEASLPIPQDPASGGSGSIPAVFVDNLGISNKLFTVYNPSQQNLDDLGGVLWESNIISQIKTLFQNPLDGIIGLSMIYCTPSATTSKDIILGNIDTEIVAPVVDNQYVKIDCGEINLFEYFGNATDYAPYTNISIYLPFIGFRDLNADDLISGSLHVYYDVDVYTGACLASLEVTKDDVTQVLYTFDGNCAVELPVTSSDRNRMLSAVASGLIGYAMGGTVGGVIGGLTNINNMKKPVSRVGNFTSNTGAMANKKPYVVISRTVPYTANNYNRLYGYPSNKRVTIGSLNGYTRVKDVHVENINCTDNEKILIENALKDGVFC